MSRGGMGGGGKEWGGGDSLCSRWFILTNGFHHLKSQCIQTAQIHKSQSVSPGLTR